MSKGKIHGANVIYFCHECMYIQDHGTYKAGVHQKLWRKFGCVLRERLTGKGVLRVVKACEKLQDIPIPKDCPLEDEHTCCCDEFTHRCNCK